MHTSWIGVMLGFSLLTLLILFNFAHGKAVPEDSPNYEGKHEYYNRDARTQFHPFYGHQNSASNPKLYYTPQIDGQPIFIPAISGSEGYVNKFLDDYYKMNPEYTQSWTLAPPIMHGYDHRSEDNYYEKGVTANSMVKNIPDETFEGGVYHDSYSVPETKENPLKVGLKKTTEHGEDIKYKDTGNKKTHIRTKGMKKRPHVISTENPVFTQYKIKTWVPTDYSLEVVNKANSKKHEDKLHLPKTELRLGSVGDYDETNNRAPFTSEKDKTVIKDDRKQVKRKSSNTDYSKAVKVENEKSNKLKDKKNQSVKYEKNSKPNREHIKRTVASEMDSSLVPDKLDFSISDKMEKTMKHNDYKIKTKATEDKYDPEVDIINQLSDEDYEPEVDVTMQGDEKFQQPATEIFLGSDDYDETIIRNTFTPEKDKAKIKGDKKGVKTETANKNTEDYKVLKKSGTKPTNLKEKTKIQSSKNEKNESKNKYQSDDTQKTIKRKDKLYEDYEPEVVDVVNLMSDEDYEPEVVDVVNQMSDEDYEPEVVDVVNQMSDEDYAPEVDVIMQGDGKFQQPATEIILGSDYDETIIRNTFTSEKDKAKIKGDKKGVKTETANKNTEDYKVLKKSGTKPTNLKEKTKIQSSKHEKNESKNKYESDDTQKTIKRKYNKLSDDYDPEVVGVVNKLSDDDYEPQDQLSDDYEPEVDAVHELSDYESEVVDDSIKEGDENIQLLTTEKLLGSDDADYDETIIRNTFTSEKDKAKMKNKKGVKTKNPNKNTEDYKVSKKSVTKTTNSKEKTKIQSSKHVKNESKNKYESDDTQKTIKRKDKLSYKPEVVGVVNKLSDDDYEQVDQLYDYYEPVVDVGNQLSSDYESEVDANAIKEDEKIQMLTTEKLLGSDDTDYETIIRSTSEKDKAKIKEDKKGVKTKNPNKNTEDYKVSKKSGTKTTNSKEKTKIQSSKHEKNESKNKYESDDTQKIIKRKEKVSYKPEVVGVVNKLSDDDYEQVDQLYDYYEPVVDVVNQLSSDYESEVDANAIKEGDEKIQMLANEKLLGSDDTDYETIIRSTSEKDKAKIKEDKKGVKTKNPNKNTEDYKVSKKPETKSTKLKEKTKIQSSKHEKDESKHKYVSVNTHKLIKRKDNQMSDDYEPEVDVVNQLSDDYGPEVDADVIKQGDEKFQLPTTETLLMSDDADYDETINTFTSEKDKAKIKDDKKGVKTKNPNKNIEDYKVSKKSETKSTKLKEKTKIQSSKQETKDESKHKYVSEDTHKIIEIKNKDSFLDESLEDESSDDLEVVNSRGLLNPQPLNIPDGSEEFDLENDGSGSRGIDENMRSVPEFFNNIESVRSLTSLNSNIWSLIFNPNAERNKLKKCVTRNNETGSCMYIQQCEVPNIATSLEQLLNNACVIDDIFIGVCCPEFPVQTVKVHWENMPSNSEKLIEDEFGHNADGELIKFWCDGYEQSLSNLLNSFSLTDCGVRSDEATKTQSWPWQVRSIS